MLSVLYKDNKQHIQFPCFVQNKFKGVRAVYYQNQLWDEHGHELRHPMLYPIYHALSSVKLVLDGVLICRGVDKKLLHTKLQHGDEHDPQQQQQQGGTELHVSYVVFDHICNTDYWKRYEALRDQDLMFPVRLAHTDMCNNEEELIDRVSVFGSVMLKNPLGGYKQGFASKNVQEVQ
jgi:hypothetical protein